MSRTYFALALLISFDCYQCQAATPSEAECESQSQALLTLFRLGPGKTTEQRIVSKSDKLEEWAAVYPNNARIRHAAGVAQFLSEDSAKAVKHFAAAYESSSDAQIGFLYSLALKINRQPLKSIEVLRDLVKDNSNLPNLRSALAATLKCVQQYDEAYQILTSLRKPGTPRPNEDYASLLWRLGECELFLGKHEQAIATLKEADSYSPDSAAIVQSLAEAHLKSDQPIEAENQLRRALKLNDSMPESHYYLGVLIEPRDHREAQALYQRALVEAEKRMKINSDNGSDHFLLYLICEKLGQNEKAKEYKKTAEQLHFTYEAPWKEEGDSREHR